MPIYIWKGRTRQGTIKKGEVEAVNEAAVMAQLRAQMLLPVSVKEKSRDVSDLLTFLKPGIKIGTCDLHPAVRDHDRRAALVQCLDILGNQQPSDLPGYHGR
jgi:type IV pilus assembly protein PilC